jgi:hypothetical protein
VNTKKCSKCASIKCVSEFSKNRVQSDGYNHYCRKCDSDRKKEYRILHPDIGKKERRERTHKVLKEVILRYGGKCEECGETRIEALLIHHSNGGGCKHRREIKRVSGTAFYEWLRNNQYPDGYSVLCGTCHLITHRVGGTIKL